MVLWTLFLTTFRQRTAADKLTGPRRQYIFDLDHQMGGEDEPPLNEQYSVDGYDKGGL